MRHNTRLALVGLLSAVALTVAARGGAGGGAGSTDHGETGIDGTTESGDDTDMRGMEHSRTDRGPDGAASGMLMENGRYSDKRFINATVPNH